MDELRAYAAEKLHININYVTDGGENGSFDPATATLTISQGARRGDATTLAHEIGEYGRAYNYDAYKQYVDTVINMLMEMNALSTTKDILAYHRTYHSDNKNTTIQDAKEELVNDVTARLFFAEGGIEQVVEYVTQNKEISVKEKKNFFETLKEIINKIVDVIKKHVTNNHLSASEKAVADMSLDDVKRLRTQFLDVIDGAISNLENGVEVDLSSTGIKFQKDISNYPYNMQSVIKNYIKSTSKKIVDFVSNYKKTSNFARLNLVPATNNQVKDLKILVGIDVTGFVNAVNTNALDHIEKRHGANGEADKSMANIEDIARMEYVIKNYDNIELLKNSNDEVKYSKEFSDKNNKPAPLVKYSKKINGTYYLIEAVVDSKFKKLWVVSAYINKNDTVTQTLNGENAPETDAHGELASPVSTNNISQNTEKSNIKKSLDVDSEGNTLSKQQQEYFKDSKVRDENGNLLVVYHGTSEEFTVFDREKGRHNMDIQGSFFSPWELDASGYGNNVRAFYLNITNPASESLGYKALRRFQGQNNTGVKAREYLESLGYDGVNNGNEEYIAFNSNQIKAVDNLNPTDSEDIRYSKDVDFDEYDENFDRNVINSFGITKINDYRHVQIQVFNTLVNEGFFDEKASRIVTNANSGMKVEINESGIEETFNYNNYQRRGNNLKLLKLATIRKIPQIIGEGVLISDGNDNYHNTNSNLKYAYIESDVNINGNAYTVKISVRKSLQKNKFWVHHIYINKNNTTDYPAGDSISKAGLLADSDDDMLTQDLSNVKFSKDVEDYDINSLIKQNKKLKKVNEIILIRNYFFIFFVTHHCNTYNKGNKYKMYIYLEFIVSF